MKQLLLDILAGDEAATDEDCARRSWLASEDGMVSFVAMVAVLFFVILLGLVGNVGLTVNQKIEVQNAADSTAYSSGVFMARGMNTVTARNHMIGELLALVVLHHAILGPEGDVGPPATPTNLLNVRFQNSPIDDRNLWLEKLTLFGAYWGAKLTSIPFFGGPDLWDDGIYDRVHEGPESYEGATVFRSKARLMKLLTSSYRVWTLGRVLASWPGRTAVWFKVTFASLIPNFPAGDRARDECERVGKYLCDVSTDFAEKIDAEWRILNSMSALARAMAVPKMALRPMITLMHQQNHIDVYLMRDKHQELLDTLAQENAVTNVTYFGRLGSTGGYFNSGTGLQPILPLRTEPPNLPQIRKSQLVRATWPWVNYWRRRPMELFRATLRLSRAAHHYKDFTNQFTLELAQELKAHSPHVDLYILSGLDLTDPNKGKGREPWTRRGAHSLRDRLFTHVGFARRDRPPLASSGFFRPENEDGFVCYAQAIVYNANPQDPQPVAGQFQPLVGWDTLNWSNRVLEYEANDGHNAEDEKGGITDPPMYEPKIFLNWRTKLVPVSRLRESSSSLPNEFADAVRRLPLNDLKPQFLTH